MKTKLDKLLEQIDPSKTTDVVASRVNDAVNSFAMAKGTICDFEDFKFFLSQFVRHVENNVLKIRNFQGNVVYDGARSYRLLKKEYGSDAQKIAFEMARTGIQGGLYKVLNQIASHITKDYAQNEISGRISHFWNALSLNEKFAVINEYAEKYGHLLPPDFTEGSAVFLKMKFTKVLEEHPHMIKRLRNNSRI